MGRKIYSVSPTNWHLFCQQVGYAEMVGSFPQRHQRRLG